MNNEDCNNKDHKCKIPLSNNIDSLGYCAINVTNELLLIDGEFSWEFSEHP